MRARRTPSVIVAMALVTPALCQVTYPDCYIQNVDWTDGTHHIVVPQAIYSPGENGAPASTTGTANTEFVSATHIRLTPGFHAGDLTSDGRFRARINPWMGEPGDVVVVPNPGTEIVDDILHVKKWEKLEIGYRLPEGYRDAIESFYRHYYPYNYPPYPVNGPNANVAVPGNIDPVHDLNPYADDSLLMVMTLTDPSGDARMKWGFYMKEADWLNGSADAPLAENLNALDAYRIRFRFAPDEVGAWQFGLTIKAPHTSTPTNEPLAEIWYSGYGFVCDPPLPENKGPLTVNPNNDRNLWFEETGEPFFGLGVNMGKHRSVASHQNGTHWTSIYRRDFETMTTTMDQLHEVGGNFMRIMMMRNNFAPEWVNLGVYDAYKTPQVCDQTYTPICDNTAWSTNVRGNCQFQCWAFDQLLDRAKAENIYIQLCIDPYPPIIDYEKFIWGAHPYVVNFLEPERQAPPDNPFDMTEFFYKDGDPASADPTHADYPASIFYYWKRKYKYIMSRWGYSVNLPIIEPFNEIDQMLSYSDVDMTPQNVPCADLDDLPHWGTCMENRADWHEDTDLPGIIDHWVTDIATYVKGDLDLSNPVASPLGETDKMFLMSYAGGSPTNDAYHLSFSNENVDLIDAHRAPDYYPWSALGYAFEAEAYRSNESFMNDGHKKPFHHGEFTSYGNYAIPPPPDPPIYEYGSSYRLFDNYDVSFHNELWASTFSSCFAAGTTWGWERVFWYPNSLPYDPDHGLPLDPGNLADQDHSDALDLGDWNTLKVGTDGLGFPIYVDVQNRTLHHHFKPLSDFLNKPSVQALGLFTGDFTPHVAEANGIECIYLLDDSRHLAVGWVHNKNAYWWNSLYITSDQQRYLACSDPSAQSIDLTEFENHPHYFVSYFPTRMNTIECPADEEDTSGDGSVTLHLNNPLGVALNGVFASTGASVNHLDTLHSDYAFIVSTGNFVKSLHPPTPDIVVETGWNFDLYPNPARDEIFLRLPDDSPKVITILDLAGRQINSWGSVTGTVQHLPTGSLARGAYWVRVSDGVQSRSKKLLVH